MFQFKRKEKLDKHSTRGFVYAGVSLLGIGYELFFSNQIRPLLIFTYSVIVLIGIAYIFYIKPMN